MKKLLPIFLSVIILVASMFGQVPKASANPAAALAVGGGVGYTAAGVYTLTGLLVASGAGVLGLEYADEIEAHARSVWDKTNDVAKQAFISSVDASISAGKGTIAIGQDVLDGFMSAGLNSWDWLTGLFSEHELSTVHASNIDSWNVSMSERIIYTVPSDLQGQYSFSAFGNGIDVSGLTYFQIRKSYSITTTWIMNSYSGAVASFTANPIYDNSNLGGTHINNWSDLVAFGAEHGISFKLDSVNMEVPTNDTLDHALNLNMNDLATGAKEVNLALDEWLATTTSGQALKYDSTAGTMTLDGIAYDGEIVWDTPALTTDGAKELTYGDPTVSLDNVTTGTTTFTGTQTGAGTETGTGTGDWTNQSAPTKKIDWSKLQLAAGALTTVFPFSIPWDFASLINVLNVEPIAPNMQVNTDENINLSGHTIPVDYKFNIDFSQFDGIAKIIRWAFILIFDIAMILGLRKLMPE